MNLRFLIASAIALLSFSTFAKSPLELSVKSERGEIEARFKGQKIFVYAFATNQFKPYVRELYTLRGDNVLRDSPPDHLHHHGLMYAVRINGVNFWEEKTDPGVEKTIRLLAHDVTENKKIPQASCTLLIYWLSQTNAASTNANDAFLIERRTLTLTVDEKNEEVALQWKGEFEIGKAASKINLQGTDYNGLGMRLPKSFDHVARFQNSENAPYPGNPKEPTRNVIPAKWSCVSGTVEQRPISIVIFGSDQNQSGNFFFSLLDAFAYSGVTQALDKQPLEFSPGEKYKLNYLVAVYSEFKDPNFLNRRNQAWHDSVLEK